MAREPIDVVRDYVGPYSGEEFFPVIEELARIYEVGGVEAVQERFPDIIDLVADDVEWQAEPVGSFRGIEGLLDFWRDWAGLWESYVYTVRSYEEVGPYVLTTSDVRARGRGGINVEMSTFQLWEVRDGRIVSQVTHLDRDAALAAAAQA